MIQATGLTRTYRHDRAPAVLDLAFEALPGRVTALLGPEAAGKSTAVRLMLGLEPGQGVALFNGRPYHRLRRPEREVGVMLAADRRPGHPGRRARGHLRMLAAAAGVSARRADQLLEQTRLSPVAQHRLRSFSPAMSRRLALAAALLGDPRTLVLDAPTDGLSAMNVEWFHTFLRAFATSGGTVLVTCRDPKEAAGLADQVVTLDHGRLAADQPVQDFVRSRLRPEVSVRGPQVGRLADLLLGRGAEVRRESGAEIAVSGLTRTEIGEIAYRNAILLHELADLVVERPLRVQRRGLRPVGASARTGSSPVSGSSAASAPVSAPVAAAPVAGASIAAAARADRAGPDAAVAPASRTARTVAVAAHEETVVVLSPGAAVSATVVGPLRSERGQGPVRAPLFRDDAVGARDDGFSDQFRELRREHPAGPASQRYAQTSTEQAWVPHRGGGTGPENAVPPPDPRGPMAARVAEETTAFPIPNPHTPEPLAGPTWSE